MPKLGTEGQELVFKARRLTVSSRGERCPMDGSYAIGLTVHTAGNTNFGVVFAVKPIAHEPQASSASLAIGHLAPHLETVDLRAGKTDS